MSLVAIFYFAFFVGFLAIVMLLARGCELLKQNRDELRAIREQLAKK